jgi:hypothetical protein
MKIDLTSIPLITSVMGGNGRQINRQKTRRKKMKTGYEAIEEKKNSSGFLNKYQDPTEDERFDLTIEEAEEIARVDPSLIYFEPSEYLVYMDCPRHWSVAEVSRDDDLSWAKNCSGVFDTREAAEAHAAQLNR